MRSIVRIHLLFTGELIMKRLHLTESFEEQEKSATSGREY